MAGTNFANLNSPWHSPNHPPSWSSDTNTKADKSFRISPAGSCQVQECKWLGCGFLVHIQGTGMRVQPHSSTLQKREVHLKDIVVAHIPSPFPCTPLSSTRLDFLGTPTGHEPSMRLAAWGLWSQQEMHHLQSPVILQWQVQQPEGLQQTHNYLCDCSASTFFKIYINI